MCTCVFTVCTKIKIDLELYCIFSSFSNVSESKQREMPSSSCFDIFFEGTRTSFLPAVASQQVTSVNPPAENNYAVMDSSTKLKRKFDESMKRLEKYQKKLLNYTCQYYVHAGSFDNIDISLFITLFDIHEAEWKLGFIYFVYTYMYHKYILSGVVFCTFSR